MYQTKNVSKELQINSSDTQLLYMPINYVYGLSVLNTGIFSCSKLVVSRFNFVFFEKFIDQIEKFNITIFSGVPFVYQAMIEKSTFLEREMRCVKKFTQAGGKLPKSRIELILEKFPYSDFIVMYGQTEFGGRISQASLREDAELIGSVGFPIDGTEIVIVDEQGGRVSDGIEGDVLIHSPSVSYAFREKFLINNKVFCSTFSLQIIFLKLKFDLTLY